MDWIIEFRAKAKDLTLISFTEKDLCTWPATQRIYVPYLMLEDSVA